MTAERRKVRDIAAVAVFLIILGVLFWPGGDEANDEADSAPNGDVSEQETPSPDPSPTAEEVMACDVQDSEALFLGFVEAVNDGEFATLEEKLPEEGAESPMTAVFPGMDQTILHSLIVHESGALVEPADVLAHFEERHDLQEQWDVVESTGHRLQRMNTEGAELDRLHLTISRTADDLPDHTLEGEAVVNCEKGHIVLLDLTTDDPDLALPIPVEDFLGAVGPYGTAEMRDLRMIVSTDLREDWGSLRSWSIHRIEANSTTGDYVERVSVESQDGEPVIDYLYDGKRWYLEQRGWREVGDITGWDVLPLEIMLTRDEPSTTAAVIREHMDEIPDQGRVTLTDSFQVRDGLWIAAAMVPRAEATDGLIEVEIEDGNLVRTRYRLVDRQVGIHSNTPEIQWVSIERRNRFVASIFIRPSGFNLDEQQYIPPEPVRERMRLIERVDHLEGIGEWYELDWDQGLVSVKVMPSRGESTETTRGDGWPLTWETSRSIANGHTIVMAGPGEDSFPQAAVWDTGEYRFELSVDPEQLEMPEEWGMSSVVEIAEALIGSQE